MKDAKHVLKEAAAGTGLTMGTVIDDEKLQAGGNYGKIGFS